MLYHKIIFNSKKNFHTGFSTVLLRPAEWFNTIETKQNNDQFSQGANVTHVRWKATD